MKNKIVFKLKDLCFIYNRVCQEIESLEYVAPKFEEMILQYSQELDDKIKERHFKELETNKHYKYLIDLKERLENAEFEFKIEI